MIKGNCHYCQKKEIPIKVINYYYGQFQKTHSKIHFNICFACLKKEESELDQRVKESEVKK